MLRLSHCLVAGALFFSGCSHELQIKNLATYNTPYSLGTVMAHPTLAITPFTGTEDDLFFFNAIVELLSHDPAIRDVRTDYIARASGERLFEPDLVVGIQPKVEYRSSIWNFLINCPGSVLFAPGWNGYVYRADVRTHLTFSDRDGRALDQLDVPMTFDLRHADQDRTIFGVNLWLALLGGIYDAQTFDRDAIPPFTQQVKETYASYVVAQAQRRVQGLADSGLLMRGPRTQAVALPANP